MAILVEGPVLTERDEKRLESLRDRARTFEDSAPRGERIRLVTESYQQTEGEPAVIRRAKAVSHALANNQIRILPDELFVGLPQRYVFVADSLQRNMRQGWQSRADYPEFTGGTFAVREDVPDEWAKHLEYWKSQVTPRMIAGSRFSPEIVKAMEYGVIGVSGFVHGHSTAGFDRVLQLGLEGIKQEATAKLAELRASDQREGQDFLHAVSIVCDGVIHHSHRYAELAREIAFSEPDKLRRDELLRIAEVCDWVPAKPARNFLEALQCVWFVQRGVDMEMGDAGVTANGFGRLDQYLYPTYRADIESSRITDDQVRLLLTEFYLKLNRTYQDTLIIPGGLRPDGADGTNELSFMLLEIHRDEKLLIDIDARVHYGSPPEFIRLCAEVTRHNLGFSMFHDDTTVEAMERIGIPREIALQYSPVGCVENIIPGHGIPTTMDNTVNVAKCLELALNNGVCMLTSEQLGPRTGDPRFFDTYERVWQAFKKQVEYFVDLGCEGTEIVHTSQAGSCPVPFYSSTWWDPVRKAKDLTEGGAGYPYSGVDTLGLATAADGLLAIRRFLFEEPKTNWDALLSALKANFEGYEDLRAMLLNEAPKYGVNDPEADAVAREVALLHYNQLKDKRTAHGGRYAQLLFTNTLMSVLGSALRTAATPDGRRNGDPIGISVSPTPSKDVAGPLAAMKSVCALDHSSVPGGMSYIMELNTEHIRDDDGEISVDMLADLIQAYVDMGGMNLAINVLDPEWLIEAKHQPEKWSHLSARYYGWSGYYNNLDSRLKDFLIARATRDKVES